MRQAPGPHAPQHRAEAAPSRSAALSRARSIRGFTLIELIVTIIIIGILAAISLAAYTSFTNRAVDTAAETSLAEFAREVSSQAVLRGDGVFADSDLTEAAAALSGSAAAAQPGVLAAGEPPLTTSEAGPSNSSREISYVLTDDATVLHLARYVRDGRCVSARLEYRGKPTTEVHDVGPDEPATECNAMEFLDGATPTTTGGGSATGPAGQITLSAAPGDRSMSLSWSPSIPGATGYRVFQSVSPATPSPLILLPAGQQTYRVTGLQNGTVYSFQVAAVGSGGDGPRSNLVSDTPSATGGSDVVLPPGNFQATVSDSSVELTWSPSPTPGARYRIYQDGAALPDVFGLRYTARNLDPRTYVFELRAVVPDPAAPGGVRLSDPPLTEVVTPGGGEGTPQQFRAEPKDRSAVLTWEAPDPATLAAGGYRITYTGQATPLVLGPDVFTTTLTGLENDVTISVELRALKADGTPGPPVTIAVTPHVAAAGPPRNLAALPGDTQVVLSWDAPTDGTPAAYRVYQDDVEVAVVPASQTSLTITGLQNERNYSFSVATEDVSGTLSPRAGPVTVTPRAELTAPRNLVGTALDRAAGLSWTAPEKGVPAGYRVFREGSTTPIATVTATTYTVTGLENFQSYVFYVVAFTSSGAVSPESNKVTVTPSGPPNPPQNLTANAGSTEVALAWDAPAGLAQVTHYSVYRDGVFLAQVPLDTRSFIATGLTNFQAYRFHVTASSTIGESDPSNELTITPFVITPPSVVVHPGDTRAYLQVTLTPGEQAQSITVLRDGAVSQTLPAGTSLVLYPTETSLQNGRSYTWTATVTSPFGTSQPSAAAPATPVAPPTAFAAPTSARRVSAPGFTASWTDPAPPASAPVTRYDLLRCPVASDQPGRIVCTPLVTGRTLGSTPQSHEDVDAPSQEGVAYVIASYNEGWRSFETRYPATVSPTSPAVSQGAPEPPAEVVLTTTTVPLTEQKTYAVSWQYYAFPAPSPITGFRVYTCTAAPCGPGSLGVVTTELDPSARSYADTTVYLPTESRTYAVASYFTNGSFTSPSPAVEAAATPTTRARPDVPGVSVTPGSASLTVSWTAPASRTPRDPQITEYRVYVCAATLPGECVTQTVSATTTSASFSGLLPGSYSARVAAVSAAGPGLAGVAAASVS